MCNSPRVHRPPRPGQAELDAALLMHHQQQQQQAAAAAAAAGMLPPGMLPLLHSGGGYVLAAPYLTPGERGEGGGGRVCVCETQGWVC